MREVFTFFAINLRKRAVCSIADNFLLNKKIAAILEIPHVGCNSHKLHLEVKKMCESD